jgi:hypothetical protein
MDQYRHVSLTAELFMFLASIGRPFSLMCS